MGLVGSQLSLLQQLIVFFQRRRVALQQEAAPGLDVAERLLVQLVVLKGVVEQVSDLVLLLIIIILLGQLFNVFF